MDFPLRRSEPVPAAAGLAEALGAAPVEVVADAFNYTALLESAHAVRQLTPDIAAIAALDRVGVIVTAPGDGAYDFVSRYFAPARAYRRIP
jgi:predicted PhzF superfamily epimerase YddE/YHI9